MSLLSLSPPFGSLVEDGMAEREERLFSLMGPVSRYSIYANEGDAEASPRTPTVTSEHREAS